MGVVPSVFGLAAQHSVHTTVVMLAVVTILIKMVRPIELSSSQNA